MPLKDAQFYLNSSHWVDFEELGHCPDCVIVGSSSSSDISFRAFLDSIEKQRKLRKLKIEFDSYEDETDQEAFDQLARLIWMNRQTLKEFGLVSEKKPFASNKLEQLVSALKTAKHLEKVAGSFHLKTQENKMARFIHDLGSFPFLKELSLR